MGLGDTGYCSAESGEDVARDVALDFLYRPVPDRTEAIGDEKDAPALVLHNRRARGPFHFDETIRIHQAPAPRELNLALVPHIAEEHDVSVPGADEQVASARAVPVHDVGKKRAFQFDRRVSRDYRCAGHLEGYFIGLSLPRKPDHTAIFFSEKEVDDAISFPIDHFLNSARIHLRPHPVEIQRSASLQLAADFQAPASVIAHKQVPHLPVRMRHRGQVPE